ncbi:MAG: hypothetical protein JSS27_03745 [Planctomycetes bacterium]|nr:hypothetical protein [Planctomycetota bacterium]
MSDQLLQLAMKRFGALTEAEVRMFRAVAEGKFPDFSSPHAPENDPALAERWPKERVVAADRIVWLATDPDATRFVTHRGIGLKGVRIDGRIDLQAANIVFALYFDRCALPAGVNLLGAEIHALNLSGSHVGRITADGAKIEASVILRAGCKVNGRVRLIGARIGGNVDCEGGTFVGGEGEALALDSAKIEGSVLLNQRFLAEGNVRLLGAEIGGNLSCEAGQFVNPGKNALTADRMKVEGNVFLSDGFAPQGRVSLPSTTIAGFFVWRNVARPQDTSLDLRSAHVGTLWFGRESWPATGKLFLSGLIYEVIDDQQTFGAETWVAWLRLQPPRPFRPQPYEQLAAVLRKDGQEGDAKRVQYAKEVDRSRNTDLAWSQWPWYRMFGPLIGYGYRPWRAFWLSLAVVIVGAILFGMGHSYGLLAPSKAEGYIAGANGKPELNPNYPQLAPFMYSLDTFTPLINLDQAEFWLPAANRGAQWSLGPIVVTTGGLLRVYMWFHIMAGWVLSSLLFVGLTGSVPGA